MSGKKGRKDDDISETVKVIIEEFIEGKELEVLIEGRDEEQPNIAVGRSYREAPDVDGQVYVENDTDSKPGDIIRVRVLQGFTYDVVGERIDG